MHIAITGGTGYIGTALTKQLLERGHAVRCLSKNQPTNNAVEHIYYDLKSSLNNDALKDIDVVIHLACYTQNNTQETAGIEINAAKVLHAAAIEKGIFFLYASSLASSPEAPTGYGKTKYAIEQSTLANGGAVMRPGFVYGGEEKGLYGTLCQSVRVFPILPAVFPVLKLQPIQIDDLTKCILGIVEKKAIGRHNLASDEQVPLTDFLKFLGKYKIKKRRLFVPVPWVLLRYGLVCVQRFLPINFDPNRLLSLRKTCYVSTCTDLKNLGVILKPLEESLAEQQSTLNKL